MINYIDLFAGAGGLSEGFTATGFHPVAHVEMNKEACNTLRTRACYYYFKSVGKLTIYNDYLSGKITRDELYSLVPDTILNTIINHTMSESSMSELFSLIDQLLVEQDIKQVDLLVGGPPCQAYSLVGACSKKALIWLMIQETIFTNCILRYLENIVRKCLSLKMFLDC